MSAADLRRAVGPLPGDAHVPVRWVRGLLGAEGSDIEDDLTLAQVAEKVGRAVSTVRGWCASGELRAYRLHGREWRVPPTAIAEFFERQRSSTTKATGSADRGAWREDAA